MKKRLMALVLVTIMLMAGVLSACSSKESDKDTKDTSKAAQEKTVQKDTLLLLSNTKKFPTA